MRAGWMGSAVVLTDEETAEQGSHGFFGFCAYDHFSCDWLVARDLKRHRVGPNAGVWVVVAVELGGVSNKTDPLQLVVLVASPETLSPQQLALSVVQSSG